MYPFQIVCFRPLLGPFLRPKKSYCNASLRAVDVLEAATAQVVLDEDGRVERVLPLPREHDDALAQRGQRRHATGVQVRLHVGQVTAAPYQVLREGEHSTQFQI